MYDWGAASGAGYWVADQPRDQPNAADLDPVEGVGPTLVTAPHWHHQTDVGRSRLRTSFDARPIDKAWAIAVFEDQHTPGTGPREDDTDRIGRDRRRFGHANRRRIQGHGKQSARRR